MQVREKILSRKRPTPFPEDTPEKYIEIVEQAWDHDFTCRQSIKKMLKQLKNMRKTEENELRPPKRSDSQTSLSSIEVSITPTKSASLQNGPLLNIDEAISLHNKEQYDKALPHFRRLAHRGDPRAAYYAGLYYCGGFDGIAKDEIKALLYLGKSAEGGYTRGQYLYAHACLNGIYYSRNEGIKYLRKAVDSKDPDALYMFSQLHLNGEHDFPVDNEKYLDYLKAAADKGSKEAKKELESK
ncbi:1139_t:CDS:1, partial [Acaulospora colombiana]